MQITEQQEKHRTRDSTPGSWNDICIVLTGKNLPDEYRHGPRQPASAFLRSIRQTSGQYNKLGLYMLQIEGLSWDLVRVIPARFCKLFEPLTQHLPYIVQ